MDDNREWLWKNATGCSTPDDANRLFLEQRLEIARFTHEHEAMAEQLRQKDGQIKVLADALEVARRRLSDPDSTTIRDRMEIDAALRLVGRNP